MAGVTDGTPCEICRELPAAAEWRLGIDAPDASPPAAARLDKMPGVGGLLHCPLCGTLYLSEEEWDYDHFIPSGTGSFRRLACAEAVRRLAAAGPAAEACRRDVGY